MARPQFENGVCIIEDYESRQLELSERTWTHIVQERGRDYFERLFDKVVETIKEPATG